MPETLLAKPEKAETEKILSGSQQLPGQERSARVSFNPKTQRKKPHRMEEKFENSDKRCSGSVETAWKDGSTGETSKRLHNAIMTLRTVTIGSQYYKIEQSRDGTDLFFRKDPVGRIKPDNSRPNSDCASFRHGPGTYDFARRGSKDPQDLGKGSTEGLIASETGSNAVSGAVIPVSQYFQSGRDQ